MNKLLKIVSSRTNWTFLGIFLVSGLNGINPYLSQENQQAIIAILAIAGAYFRSFPKQDML